MSAIKYLSILLYFIAIFIAQIGSANEQNQRSLVLSVDPACPIKRDSIQHLPTPVIAIDHSNQTVHFELRLPIPEDMPQDQIPFSSVQLTLLKDDETVKPKFTLKRASPNILLFKGSFLYKWVPPLRKQAHSLYFLVDFPEPMKSYSTSFLTYVLHPKGVVRLFDYSQACHVSFPPRVISKAYVNRAQFGNQDLDFGESHESSQWSYKEDLAGILELNHFRGRSLGSMGVAQSQLQFYSRHRYTSMKQNRFAVDLIFRIPENLFGYIIQHETFRYVPYADIRFSNCGHLEISEKFPYQDWQAEPLKSHSLLTVEPQYVDSWDYIENRLLEYPIINECRGQENEPDLSRNSTN